MRCILVDDSEEFLASASRLLESHGLEIVACASTSKEALQLSKTLRPDVVVVDLVLGDEDGAALARELAEQALAAPVILISSYERDDVQELIAHTTATGFLFKRDLSGPAIRQLLA